MRLRSAFCCWCCWGRSTCCSSGAPRISDFDPDGLAAAAARPPIAPPTSWITPGRRSIGRSARALRTRRFWWLAAGYFCALFSWYAIQVHQTKYLIEIGFAPGEAAWALGLVSLVAVPGQIALGHLSDRIGREWVWMIGNLGFVLCFLCLLALRGTPTTLLLCVMVVAQGTLGYGLTSVMGADPRRDFRGPPLRQHLRHGHAGGDPGGRGGAVDRGHGV